MATKVHSVEAEGQIEGSDDEYWPAIEILAERKGDYLVNWDGINPDTGRAWTPSWTSKTVVTEDLVEAWEAKKAAKKKGSRRVSKKPKRSHIPTTPTSSKPANRNSRSSRTSRISSSRATDSPVISLKSNNSPGVEVEPFLGKRKRQSTKHAPADENPKPVPKKLKVNGTLSKSHTKSIESSKRVRETIREEEEEEESVRAEDSDIIIQSPSTSKAHIDNSIIRIGPPRKHKKIPPLPPATPPSTRALNSAFRHPREEEEENIQQATVNILHLDVNRQTARKKKRRLKPVSETRQKPPVVGQKKPSVPPSRDVAQEPEEPSGEEEPFETNPPPPGQDGYPAEPPPDPSLVLQKSPPDPPAGDVFSNPAPGYANKHVKKLAPIPRPESSYFKPYLRGADTTSLIDEFSPKKSFPTQETIESSVHGSQVYSTTSEPRHQRFDLVDDPFDEDIAQKVKDAEDAYLDLDGHATEFETPNEEQPITDHEPGEQERSRSPTRSVNVPIPVQSSHSQKLEDALVLLNQKSEEIEGLKNRLVAQEAHIEHLRTENYGIQVEYEKLSVAQEVQREALEDAKGTVSEMGVHIDWVQGSLDKSEATVKQLQGEIRDALKAKAEEQDLLRVEWEKERAALEAQLASSGGGLLPTSSELEKKELEDKLAEVTKERDQLDEDNRYAMNEVESWKEQYRNEFIRSQELRQDAKDAKAETNRVQGENMILASQTKEAVRLITLEYKAVVEKLKKELARAVSLYKVLQSKDEKTGDDLRRRAASATNLQEEVRRLHGELISELAEKAARAAKLENERYTCQFQPIDNSRCDQDFDSPQELWTHVLGHIPSKKHK